jgi:3'-phosphoadenosine 5'-phosphosulfate sulfotransferase (PAPS reductase)/FAD synthetase
MANESKQRESNWIMYGCNAFEKKRPTSQPLSFWTEQDILEYLVKFNIPYSPVYGDIKQDENGKYYTTVADRTGCMFCMFGCHLEKEPNRFQRIKVTHPKQWDYCMNKLGLREVLEYIGVAYE